MKAALVQADGRIVLAGNFNEISGAAVAPLVRLTADGQLDLTFSAAKLFDKSRFAAVVGVDTLAVQADGKLLVGGSFISAGSSERHLIRLTSDGAYDDSFDAAVGIVVSASPQPDGTTVVMHLVPNGQGATTPQVVRLKANGNFDPGFNPQIAATPYSIATQPDGKLLVGMAKASGALVRLNADGSRDETFDARTLDLAPSGGALPHIDSIVVQPDGRIAVAQHDGTFGGGKLIRIQANGSPDPSFQQRRFPDVRITGQQADGKLLIVYSASSQPRRLNVDGSDDLTLAVGELGAILCPQGSSKLITAGSWPDAPFAIRRVNLDGTLDASFMSGSDVVTVSAGYIRASLLLPDGKIVVGGDFGRFANVPRNGLVRLKRDGSVDADFEAPPLAATEEVESLCSSADGTILVGLRNRILRLHDDGSLVRELPLSQGESLYALAEQSDGKLLIGSAYGLRRLLSDGTYDPDFFVTPNPGAVTKIVLDVNSKITATTASGLRRFKPDGTEDAAFRQAVTGSVGIVSAMALQHDGKLLISGSGGGFGGDQKLARLNADGTLDSSFHPAVPYALKIAIDQTGIFAAIPLSGNNELPIGAIVRLNLDGSRDSGFASLELTPFVIDLLVQSDGQVVITGIDTLGGAQVGGLARLLGNAPRKLANISTRAEVGPGDDAAIGGFIVTGTEPKRIMIRGLGPSLSANGVNAAAALADPALEVHNSPGDVIGRNFDWHDSQASEIAATGLAPADAHEAAIVMTLAPGEYTSVLRGTAGTGTALLEIYDLTPGAESMLANISTRAVIGGGDRVMIAGFMLRGPDQSTVAVRALGPSLSNEGVRSVATDPSLELRDIDGALVATNDNWKDEQETTLRVANLAPANDEEAALVESLPPGAYTAIMRDKNANGGVGLIEVYRLP